MKFSQYNNLLTIRIRKASYLFTLFNFLLVTALSLKSSRTFPFTSLHVKDHLLK